MSLKSDAETVADLAHKIVTFEILRQKLQANGGIIFANGDDPETAVTLTAGQKQTLLALESGWQTTIKNIAAAWTP